MRKLLATTALAAAFGAAAVAQTTDPVTDPAATPVVPAPADGATTTTDPAAGGAVADPTMTDPTAADGTSTGVTTTTTTGPATATTGGMVAENAIEASELLGARLYAADYDGDAQTYHDSGAAWEDIGEVSDVLVTPAGDVAAVLVDVGGFLGVGERVVALGMDEIALIRTADGDDDWRAVVDRSRESLEEQPEFDADTALADNGWTSIRGGAASTGMADATTTTGGMDATSSTVRAGWVAAQPGEYSVDDLRGVTVYGSSDEEIGEISDIVLSQSGDVEAAVVDVGGFLGIGARSVAIPFSAVDVLRAEDGDDYRAYVTASESELRAMPEYEAN